MKKIILINNPSDIATPTIGAGEGFEALKDSAKKSGSDYFQRYKVKVVQDENANFDANTSKNNRAKNLDLITKVAQRCCDTVAEVIKEGNFPLVIAGDHSNAFGTIAGLKKAYPNARIGVIWIDAHADLHSPYSTPSGNVHGMPLAAALGLDNKEYKKQDPTGENIQEWHEFKNVGGISPKILAEDLVYVGVRSTELVEQKVIADKKIKWYKVDEVRRNTKKTAKEILSELSDCEYIYVSFDVDSMDSEKVANGTGTAVPNGFLVKEINELLEVLLKSEKVCCFEITEINPSLDTLPTSMADVAFPILEKATKVLENR